MLRLLRTRLLPAWRSAERTLWPDALLAGVLSIVAIWLTIAGGGGSGGDHAIPSHLLWPTIPVPPGPDVTITLDDPAGWTTTARDVVLNLLITAPLVLRRRSPLACVVIQFAGLLPFDNHVNTATLVALLIGAYSLAVYGRSALVSLGVLTVAAAATAAVKDRTWPELPDWAGVFVILLPIGLSGIAIAAARSRAQASEERAAALKREQHAATHLAVAQERARIARELHDVVSHHVSVMTIQAGAAGKVLDTDPESARGALQAIEGSGRETMTELRHLLGVLTPEPADDLLHPQPGLDQLDALIENVRQAGQPVSVRRTAAVLAGGVDLTAYRVVQEALTNALRYAPGARTDIAITTEPGGAEPQPASELVIEVTNDAAPPGARPGAADGTGTGLLGLAERLRLYGGTLEAGRRAGGGFRVRARMPLAGVARLDAPFEPA